MESSEKHDIIFLSKPTIKKENLKVYEEEPKIYANLFEIKINKELRLFQYPYSVEPPIDNSDMIIRRQIFRVCSRELRAKYGDCFVSGDSLYTIKKIDEIKILKCTIYSNESGRTEYKITIDKYTNEKIIKQEDVNKNPLTKQFIELIIKDILHSNPKLEFYKGLFVLTTKKETIKDSETNKDKINFYPGFATSFMETDSGNYLNVTLKNKIIQTETILQYINRLKEGEKTNEEIRGELVGRSFKVNYAKRNYTITDILFDRDPTNTKFIYNGKDTTLVDYYETAHRMDINDKKQPLILVRKQVNKKEKINLYFIPEFCSLAGLEEEYIKDGKLMKQLSELTKLEPTKRVNETKKFIELLVDEERNDKIPNSKSAKEKSELYGIEIKPLNNLFKAYYLEGTKLLDGNNMEISSKSKTFDILEKIDLTNWVCVCLKQNMKHAKNFSSNLIRAAKAFGLNVSEPYYKPMSYNSKTQDWLDIAKKSINNYNNDFIVFLIDDNDEWIYPELKQHSLCKNGYVSQIVKISSISRKGVLSVCSKILLQINAKLRGISYKANIDKDNLMVIGVNSSHIKGKRTGVAMVATINNTYTDFYNNQEIIEEKNYKTQLQLCVNSFIEKAINAYKDNNNEKPNGIVIYRQGVSLHQKEFLKDEIGEIENMCKNKDIPFYYILVNIKTTFKFFEEEKGKYYNPYSGLLVIEGVTNKNYFEFYIQPQEVQEGQGSATPTCYHVAYGNLNLPEFIYKFIFDLCHLYSNWQGPIRIPNVLKAAEKLSKMTAKYKLGKLNDNLQLGQAYL